MSKNLANVGVNLCPFIDKKRICSKANHFGYYIGTSDETSTNGAYVFLHLLLGYFFELLITKKKDIPISKEICRQMWPVLG